MSRTRGTFAFSLLAALFVFALGSQVVALPASSDAHGETAPTLNALYDVAVDVGGTAPFSDLYGVTWRADRAYSKSGGWGHTVTGTTELSTHAVSGTVDGTLYQTARAWRGQTGTYRFDVPTGTFQINLRFADMWNSLPLSRQFDVQIQGIKYLSNMDIVSAIGPYTAYDWTFVVTVTSSPLRISFIPQASVPIVAGIHVTQLQSYSAPAQAAYPRIGVGVNWAIGRITDYDVASMHLGWYSYWGLVEHPDTPNGIEYVQLINTRGLTPANLDTQYNWAALSNTITNNIGATWIIGNEVEATYQGNHTPQQYAQVFKRFYDYIKSHDNRARVAIGGVTMVTPARLEWISEMAAAYISFYHTSVPADIWTIHEQIVGGNEAQIDLWPAGVPTTTVTAEYHSWVCNQSSGPNDFAQFKRHINRMRSWMSANGFRDKPLWISEYGVLGGDQYNCTQQVIGSYIRQTMQWLNKAANATTGQPSDDNRLVQRWLWYSLNDQPYNPSTHVGFAGALFDRASPQYPGALTGVGRAYCQWVRSITPPGPTATPTNTPTPKATRTPTQTATPTATATATSTPTPYLRRVNAGGTRVTDNLLQVWSADKAFAAGGWGYTGPATGTITTTATISGTLDGKLYQTARTGMTGYRFSVANGVYSVTLKFAEIQFNRAGKRQFDVTIQGAATLGDYDIWQVAGAKNAAREETFGGIQVTDGLLQIKFLAKPGFAVPSVSAMEIRQN